MGEKLMEVLISIQPALEYQSIRVDWYREVADPSGGVGTADGVRVGWLREGWLNDRR
jgi:hypothetical protein